MLWLWLCQTDASELGAKSKDAAASLFQDLYFDILLRQTQVLQASFDCFSNSACGIFRHLVSTDLNNMSALPALM